MQVVSITVPGGWDPEIVCLDLETAKVPTGGFVMQNGEPLKNRWSIILAGIASLGSVYLVYDGEEIDRLEEISCILTLSYEVRYAATRQFDEMICKGRFTNARRAHEKVPFFPSVPDAETFNWRNLGNFSRKYYREYDIESKAVPASWKSGNREVVLVHLARDIAELILTANPDGKCEYWCSKILADYNYAASEIKSTR